MFTAICLVSMFILYFIWLHMEANHAIHIARMH